MNINTYIYDNLPQILEYNENLFEDCQFSFKKINHPKALFRIQSPEPSIIDECIDYENEQSFDIDIQDNQYTNLEQKTGHEEQKKIYNTKKNLKSKKLLKKTHIQSGPLSEKEFIEIVKKLEQCQQVMQMLDSMSYILSEFKTKVVKDKSQIFKRIK